MTKLPFGSALLLTTSLVAVSLAQAEEAKVIEEIIVTSPPLADPRGMSFAPDQADMKPAADGGDFLRGIAGVSGSRMGGHGIDPVIRGMQGNQLNIINDGAQVHGGCPNRMDPPTSFIATETYDEIVVTQGYQSVAGSSGGSGGTVEFKRHAPEFEEGEIAKAEVGGGYVSNGNVRDAYVDGAMGKDGTYIRVIGNMKKADNYDDGDGNEVRSSFEERSADLTLGYEGEDGLSLEAGVAMENIDDAVFAGAGMDSPYSEDVTLKAKAALPVDGELIEQVRANVFLSRVDHRMDNYTLRTRTAPMAMRVDSESDTLGGELALDLNAGGVPVTFGLTYQENERDAARFAGMMDSNVNMLNARQWPGTEIEQFGLYAEGTFDLAEDTLLIAGLRFDRNEARATKANDPVANGTTPNNLYAMYYGVTANEHEENNIGGLLRLEHDISAETQIFAGLSRSIRAADATERYMSSMMMSGAWVGNPDLDAEKHHQFEVGLNAEAGQEDQMAIQMTAFIDVVDDYILRDAARGQDGILLSNGATVYRNMDAMLAGITASASWDLGDGWRLAGDAAYTYGEDLDLDQPLAQIPPLEGSLTLSYETETWSLGGKVAGAAKQSRVDTDATTGSGRDIGKTSGWITADLFGTYEITEGVGLRAGITNLFDREYAQHLNRSNSFDPVEIQVNEPGRSAYIRASVQF